MWRQFAVAWESHWDQLTFTHSMALHIGIPFRVRSRRTPRLGLPIGHTLWDLLTRCASDSRCPNTHFPIRHGSAFSPPIDLASRSCSASCCQRSVMDNETSKMLFVDTGRDEQGVASFLG
jgi:hypothetical protein